MAATSTPKGTKRPADRKPKAGEPYKVDVRGKVWTIEPAALDDFELLDDLAFINSEEEGAAMRFPAVLRRLLGPEQYRKALDHLRDPDTKRVGVEAGSQFVKDIFERIREGN